MLNRFVTHVSKHHDMHWSPQPRAAHPSAFTSMLTAEHPATRSLTRPTNGECLSAAYVRDLAERYDPEHMNPADYATFLDELSETGVLTPEETSCICYECLLAHDRNLENIVRVTPTGRLRMDSIDDAHGNMRDWARCRSAWLACDTEHGLFYPDKAAIAYLKVSYVFEQMLYVNV